MTLPFHRPHIALGSRSARWSAAALLSVAVGVTAGCPPTSGLTDSVGSLSGARTPSPSDLSQDRLQATIDAALSNGFHGRQLSVERNGAWQILHGVLAYGLAFQVETADGLVPAMQYALDGGPINGFEPLLGDRFTDPVGRGVRMELDPGTKIGQGHRDQWLKIISRCDLPPETPIQVQGETRQVIDLVRQTEWDIPRNLEAEYSWTLIGLTAYRGTTHFWTARDGRTWSIEQLVASELERDLRSSACGGTHRMIGMAMALNRHRQNGGRLTGTWADVDRRIADVIAAARQHQNGDGSFSSAYFHRPGWTPDLAEVLSTTGHTLEMLAIAADDATLAEPWVERAALRLCEVLELTANVELECGALYHALHGLVVYHQRRFGDWEPAAPAT